MKLQRLVRMGMSELAYRGWQEAAKRLDRAASAMAPDRRRSLRLSRQVSGDPGFPDAHPGAPARAADGAAEALLERFRCVGPDRFFAGLGDGAVVKLIGERLPHARDRTVAAAEALMHKRFDLLGHRGLFFGDPIDWHLDPIAGVRSPRVHWSRIDPLDAKRVGDSKVIWELNRHQWLIDLGLAYRFTGDQRYARACAAAVREWMEANPPGIGINWASSLEVALRLIAWCWALFLVRGAPVLTPALYVNVLAWIGAHATHVERYLSCYFSPNTHLTGEALGLFYAGAVFPELSGAARWRERGQRILLQQLDRQVLPDGVYFEQSTCYQRYTVEIYLHLLLLAARNRIALPAAVGPRVQQMLDFLLALRRPDGSMPQIGDADGGTLLPLMPRAADDFRGVFAVAAVLFRRADYAWAAQGQAVDALWLLGADALAVLEGLKPAPPATSSRLFADGGYAVMRSGWEARAHQLIFDVGPLGCRVSGGHGHADLLAIECAVFGKPYLMDAGTYCYTPDARWRDYFRGSAAHSTVMVDGLSQADAAGPFGWAQRPRARLRRWVSNDDFDLADAEHDAYARLADPVRHRRRVFFAKPRYWVVVDELGGEARHRIDLRFQLAPIDVRLSPGQWVRARGPEGGQLLIRCFAAVPLASDCAEGTTDPIGGWVSSDYGRREPAPQLTYSATAPLPLRFVTLLLPMTCLAPPPPVTADVAGGRIELVLGRVRETIHISADDIVRTCRPSTADRRETQETLL